MDTPAYIVGDDEHIVPYVSSATEQNNRSMLGIDLCEFAAAGRRL